MFLQNVNMQQRSKPENVPAPVGGLNRRDALASMPPQDAYEMDNIFPGTTSVKVRNGCTNHQTGMGGAITSLVTYTSAPNYKMFGQVGSVLYDVTVKGTVTSVKTGIVGVDIQSVMFANSADNKQWLLCCTGDDTPFAYNGTTWSNLIYTGVAAPQDINYFYAYKGRVYMTVENRCGFYYLAPGAIQGAAEWYDLGQICKKGGAIVGITTFSEDSGDGPNQYIVFISDQGEYVMYEGQDPGDAASWQLVGRYMAGQPIGRHAIITYAGDVLIITIDGVMQLSDIRKLSDTRTEITALSSKLGDYFKDAVPYADQPGWHIIMYPKGSMILVTVPNSANPTGGYSHFVMNTITQAWCRFTSADWHGRCWTILQGNLYFGRQDGTIRRADDGQYDVQHDISIKVSQAWNYFGGSGNKQFKWVECLIMSEAPATLAGVVKVNFGDETMGAAAQNPLNAVGAVWDVSYWDADTWGSEPTPRTFVVPYQNYGFVASLTLQGAFGGVSFEWFSSKWVFEQASGLL